MGCLVMLLLVGQNIDFVSSAVLSGADRKLVVADDRLYSACERGLDIFDISQPESIRMLGHFDTPGIALGCAVAGSLAFVADNHNGVLALDVGDPAAPELLATYPLASVEEAVVRDTLLFCGSADLEILSVADPRSPYRIGSVSGVGVKRLALADTLCLVATQQGLRVYGIADPTRPRLIETVATGWLRDVQVQGNHAYVCGDTELVVVDLGTLSPVGRYDAGYLAFGLGLEDSLAVVCRGQQLNAHLVDISDPTRPAYLAQVQTGNGPQDAAVAGGWAFVGVWSQDMLVIDVSNPRAPAVRGRVHRPGELNGAWRDGPMVVTADRWFGLSVVDVSDVENPVERGELALAGWPRRLVLVDTIAYVANYDGLAIVSIGDPDRPRLLAQTQTDYYTYKVAVKDTLAFVAEREWNPYNGNLLVLSVADPENPRTIGIYPTSGGGVEAVAQLVGDHCYVVSQGWSLNEFAIVSVSDPTAPRRVSGCSTEGYPVDVDAANEHAYVLTTSPTNQLLVVSIRDTLNPTIVNSIDMPNGPRALFVRPPYAYVSYYYFGVEAFDITDPVNPVSVAAFNTTGNSHGMFVDADRYIYLADGHSLQILRMLTAAVAGTSTPNQVVPTSICRGQVALGASLTGTARVIDAAGRVVMITESTDGVIDLSGFGPGVYHIRDHAGRGLRVIQLR